MARPPVPVAVAKPPAASLQDVQYASQEDWDKHRATITQLYLHEDRTLRDVMDYMAQTHHFKATVKMYRTRIKKWQLDKNNKMDEVVTMLRLKKERDAVGKGSRFFIRGRRVSWDDVERYLSRNPTVQAKISDDDGGQTIEIGSAALGIVCRSPTPDFVRIFAVPRNLDGARDVRIHEEILSLFTTYMEGAYDQGIWGNSIMHNRAFGLNGARGNARLNNWASSLRTATDWLGREIDSVQIINCQMDELRQIITDQDCTLFPCLLRACFYLSSRRPRLGLQVTQFVAAMFGIVLGEHHPMTRAWQRIRTLPISEYLLVLENAARVRLDHLANYYPDGFRDENTIRALREYILVLRLRPEHNAEEIQRQIDIALFDILSVPQDQLSGQHCRLLINVASSQIAAKKYAEAEATLDRVGQWVEQVRMHDRIFERIAGDRLFNMALLRLINGRADEAHDLMLEAREHTIKTFGTTGMVYIDIMTGLVSLPVSRTPEELAGWKAELNRAFDDIISRTGRKGLFSYMYQYQDVDNSDLLNDGPWDTDVGNIHAAKLRIPKLPAQCRDLQTIPGVYYEYDPM
ncbi:hypothetical protein B0H63DRAFT_389421 [Podospora didyma]|uniref:Clr5 domain-containing protein n=1 Tax=Podospora didyma TaxID=330526 RepID=A0AAE0NYA3_9PEZI|nr:hypothetical protein B0H63DRAFT_389421 [Podospora didyma]